MCVALPGRVEWVGEGTAASVPGRIRIGDTSFDVDLLLVPGVREGDHVIVHSGYAIAIVSDAAADESRALLNEVL